MPISFESLNIGQEYDREFLSDLWGYASRMAISRGVITPKDSDIIVLFVTKIKDSSATQYEDYIDGDMLFWEGEEKHGNDHRVINASANNEHIHLLYRDVHHQPFTYKGEIFLEDYQLQTEKPSEFIFSIELHKKALTLLDDLDQHANEYSSLDTTEKQAVVSSRIGQGLFRKRVIQLWGTCAVTGLSNLSLLKASHIKPWINSSNHDRTNPMNGLLLEPTLDHLFDAGYISFNESGNILTSSELSQDDLAILNLGIGLHLRFIPDAMQPFLQYHRDEVFKH